MNTSRRTAIIAQGIYHWAMVQDAVPCTPEYNRAYDLWMDYQAQWPREADYAQREQFQLFDRVNGEVWA